MATQSQVKDVSTTIWQKILRRLPTLEDYAFFSLAVGFDMPWTALSSELGFLKTLHGPEFLLHLNFASCAPCLPTLILQLIFDQGQNRRFGTANATMFRQVASLLLCTVILATLPFLPWTSKPVLLAIGICIGTAGSVAFGSTSSLVARFPAQCGQALALGIVAGGPTVLLLQAVLRIGAHPSPLQQQIFYLITALAPLNALIAVIALLRKHWKEIQEDLGMAAAEGAIATSGPWDRPSMDHWSITESLLDAGEWNESRDDREDEMLLPAATHDEVTLRDLIPAAFANIPPIGQHGAEAVLMHPDAIQRDGDCDAMTVRSMAMTIPTIPASVLAGGPVSVIEFAVQHGLWAATKTVAPLAISLGSSVGVTVMMFPLFTVVRSSGLLGSMLPQALFAACMLPDIAGRVIARSYLPSLVTVEVLAVIKFASMFPALGYLWAPAQYLSDISVVLFVVVHWMLNGLINAWAYMLLPQALPDPQAAALGGAVMSTAFQAFSIAGLGLALILEHVARPPTEV